MSNDKKTQQEETMELVKTTVQTMLESLLPHITASQAVIAKQVNGQAPRPAMCHECKQHLSACGGKHAQIVVLPTRRPEYAKWYQGFVLNGIRYLSNHPNHTVTVPASIASTIINGVELWENTEYRARQGKQAEHQSGSIDSPRRVDRDGTTFV